MRAANEFHPLLSNSACLRLFAMLRYAGSTPLTGECLDDHISWMIHEEKHGTIVLSGPITHSPSIPPLIGMTILRATDRSHATRIADSDPFVATGTVVYDLHDWTVLEGTISMTATLSNSAVTTI